MKVKVKQLLGNEPVEWNNRKWTDYKFMGEDEKLYKTNYEVKVGEDVEGELGKEYKGFTQIKKAYSGGGGGKFGKSNPETQAQIIRQNALGNAVSYCVAKAQLMDKKIALKQLTGKHIVEVATFFAKYSLGKVTVVMTPEEISKEFGYKESENNAEDNDKKEEAVTANDQPPEDIDKYLEEN